MRVKARKKGGKPKFDFGPGHPKFDEIHRFVRSTTGKLSRRETDPLKVFEEIEKLRAEGGWDKYIQHEVGEREYDRFLKALMKRIKEM